ncbi:hypothetical protein BUALT_Bualt01G0141400 [Buddleja alternifolia]|uniref:Ribulose bisphosphate carboxylase large subunit C-terminal domain-containing protein n=1 Tax=Buddleja alternifolia TaxID=168488 RepID=A0AAV6YHU9_9LAMI|nr:hypothetical protein BUALT_Bualt01G0141400 [Buddleja alternifolia]
MRDIKKMQGRLSAWLVKHGIIHRSLGFDYQGIETLQIKAEDWHSIAVILYVYGYNYLRCQCGYDVAPGRLLASVYHLTRIEYGVDQPEEVSIPRLNPIKSLASTDFAISPFFYLENVNSQPFMYWRDRFLFCAEAIYKAQAEIGEIKGHYLNASAGTCEEMMKRAIFSRELGVPIIMHDYLTGGFTANTSLAHYCRDNGLLLYIHRAMIAVIDRQKNHGIHFRVLAKALRMSGGDHIHSGTLVGKFEGEKDITLGFVDLLRDDFIEKDRSRGIYFTQDWVSLLVVIPVALGGIHVWHMPALTEISRDDSVLQFGGGTSGHPWGNTPGAVASRVALEACVEARNEGCDLAAEGNTIIREACKWSPEVAAAYEVWKEIKFEFAAMDTLDKLDNK